MIVTCIGCGADATGIHDVPGVRCCGTTPEVRERQCPSCEATLNADGAEFCEDCTPSSPAPVPFRFPTSKEENESAGLCAHCLELSAGVRA